jgi:Tfp pilus assembly protein PilX
MTPTFSLQRFASRQRQGGIVVFVALIAVVLLSLAAVALMRSVHTSTLVIGNLAFRQAAMSMSTAAVETAVYDMFAPTRTIPDLTNNDLARNYYATLQPGEDALGVPAALQSVPAFGAAGLVKVLTDDPLRSGNTARYVIERMCVPAALTKAATGIECEMIPPKQSPAGTANEQENFALPRIPFYRLTVRVDGPNNSVTFSQAMLR